jgi:hypothetical protein
VRRLGILLAVTALAALAPASARAALFLMFTTTNAVPGTVVIARTGGDGALSIASGSTGLRVFLAPAEQVDSISSPGDARLLPLGRLRVDENGNGHLRFVVPDVPPGDYVTLTHCVPCAPYSAGRELLPTGPSPGHFIVLGSEGSGQFPVIPVAAGAAAVGLLGVVLGVAWTLRRRRDLLGRP